MSEQFLFDDFFVPEDDAGVEETVTIRGREIPIRIKKGLSLKDREEAKSKAVKTHLDPKGALQFDGFDEGAFNIELLARCIKSWPFTYGEGHPKAGQQVPVSREMVAQLRADGADAFQELITRLVQDKKEALAPFEKP